MTQKWYNNVADLISGRLNNTALALNTAVRQLVTRIDFLENIMTQNEQIILNAATSLQNTAAALNAASAGLNSGIDALLAKIDSIPGVEREDLSDELAALTSATQLVADAASGIGNTAGRLTPAAPAVDVATEPAAAGPIEHTATDATPTALAGDSGPTDAGVDNVQPGPGTAEPVVATEPVVDPISTTPGLDPADTPPVVDTIPAAETVPETVADPAPPAETAPLTEAPADPTTIVGDEGDSGSPTPSAPVDTQTDTAPPVSAGNDQFDD